MFQTHLHRIIRLQTEFEANPAWKETLLMSLGDMLDHLNRSELKLSCDRPSAEINAVLIHYRNGTDLMRRAFQAWKVYVETRSPDDYDLTRNLLISGTQEFALVTMNERRPSLMDGVEARRAAAHTKKRTLSVNRHQN